MDENQAYRVERLLAHLSYKQGWTFKVIHSCDQETGMMSDSGMLLITHMEPNAADPAGPKVTIGMTEPIPDYSFASLEDAEIVRWIMTIVERAELHEVREWLKFDGHHVRDPHPELLNAPS